MSSYRTVTTVNQDKSKEKLRLTQKLDLMRAVFNRKPIRSILGQLSNQQLVEAHGFLWDKLVEVHYLFKNSEFRRENVTEKMVPSATYQKQQGCDLRLDYCKGVECIWSHPVCAGNKVKNNMEVMASTIGEYLNSVPYQTPVTTESKSREEVKLWL